MLLHEALVDEQEELRQAARRVCARGDWDQVGALGWAGLAVPERLGGAGLGHAGLCAILEELGRALAPAPLLATTMAAEALLAGGDETWLPRLCAGELTASLVAGELALAAAVYVALVDGRAAVTEAAEAVPALDLTRGLSRIPGAAGQVPPAARVLLAAEQLGGAARCLEISVVHARARVQFGRPIGSFQAVKHLCADMLVRVEAARSACRYAAWALDEAPGDAAAAADLAAVTCGAAYLACAGDAIEVHGGIGFTWEHEAGRHLRRARAGAALLGDPGERRDAIARGLGL